MSNIRTGVRIARQLQTAEHAVDSALIATSALIQAMIEGRLDAKLAADVGHGELVNLVGSLNRLTDARELVVRSHGGLGKVAEELGIAWRMEGPYEKKLQPSAVAPLERVG